VTITRQEPWIYLDENHAKETEAVYKELVKAGIASLGDVQFQTQKNAEIVSTASPNFMFDPQIGLLSHSFQE
jgi:hypothetical protein